MIRSPIRVYVMSPILLIMYTTNSIKSMAIDLEGKGLRIREVKKERYGCGEYSGGSDEVDNWSARS